MVYRRGSHDSVFVVHPVSTVQLGAGPGTALVMSLLVVIGTLLPLIEDHVDDAASPAALVTIVGLVFAISGFVSSGKLSFHRVSSWRAPM